MDYNTIFYMNALANFIITLGMIVHWRTQKTYDGFGYWVLANVFIMLFSILGLSSRLIFHSPLLTSIANTFFTQSVALRYIGIRKFWSQYKVQRHILIIMIIILLGYVSMSFIPERGHFPLTFGAIVSTYFYIKMIHFLKKIRVESNRVLARLILFSSLVYLIVMNVRMTALIINYYYGFKAPSITIMYFIVQNLTDIILAMSFIMLNSQRLASELKTAKEKTEEVVGQLAETMAVKDKLFTVIVHDIRGTLALSVNTMNQINKLRFPDKDYEEMVDGASRSINFTYDVTENLITWYKSQQVSEGGNPTAVSIFESIDQVIESIRFNAAEKEIRIKNELGASAIAFANREEIQLVFRNILSNAVKYSFRGSTITIECKESGSDFIVSIKDNGVGIEKDKIKMLFKTPSVSNTFGTEGEKGTGVGLNICSDIVKKNNGDIWVESTIGEGSTFYVSLPKAQQL